MADVVCSLIIVLLLGLLWVIVPWVHRHHAAHLDQSSATASGHRVLKPRTPDDCSACRRESIRSLAALPPPPAVRPWREHKSRRGAPRRIPTDGFACPNRACAYYRITDAQIHALVGDGTHGKHEAIQTFRCQACRATFSARRDTPLYRLKTASQRVGEVLSALAEGLDLAAAARVFGHRPATITTWLTRAGEHSTTLHDRWFRHLHLPHVQLDELHTRVRRRPQVRWLWLAVDPLTKLIPVVHLGVRSQASAHTIVHDLQQRLAPDCLPVFTSDGLNHYFYALIAHFGQWMDGVGRRRCQWQVAPDLIYGQVKKTYRRRKVVRVTQLMRWGTRTALRVALTGLGLSGRLNTAFIERVNLTLRQSVAALVRRTWSTMQAVPHVLAHVEWWRAYYHFVRPDQSLRIALAQPQERGGKRLSQRYRQRTPAMAAGLTNRRWTVTELLAVPLPAMPGGAD
jgi:IS1 family transposase